MKKLYLSILLILLFIFQSCILKNQPPIIENMTPNGQTITSNTVTFKWIAKDPEDRLEYYNFFLFSNGKIVSQSLNHASNSYKIENLENGEYEWLIQAFDVEGNKSEKSATFKIDIPNNSPIKSFLIYPENNNSVNPYNLTFKWNKSVDFDGDYVFYNLYLSDSTPLTTPIATNLNTTQYTIEKLKLNTTYYWMVESYDTNGASEISNIWSFKTLDNTPPIVDFPKKEYIVKENESFEIDLSNFVSDMEDNYFEYQLITNNGAYIQGSKYIFKPGYDFVKHPYSEKKIQEQIIISDSKDTSSGVLNILIKDVNRSPETPKIIYPLNNSIIPKDFTLKWECSDPDGDSLTFDIYTATSQTQYSKIATGVTNNKYNLNLNYNTEYYIKVVAIDSYGKTKAGNEIKIKTQKTPYQIEWEKDLSDILDIFDYNNTLIIVTKNGIYNLSTTGEEIKHINLSNLISNSVIFENKLYIPDSNGNINIVNLNSFEIENSIFIENNILGITISKDYKNIKRVYAISQNGVLTILNLNTNELEWSKSFSLSPIGPVLIIENGYIVIGGNDGNNGKILILKPKGKIFKELSFNNSITSLISNDNNSNIYFAIDNIVYKYSKDGNKIWELSLSENIENEILNDGNNIIATSKNKIFILDNNGTLINTYNANNLFSKTMTISKNNNIYGITENGIVINNKINNIGIENIISYSRINDGLLYFASKNKLYSLSIGNDEKNNNYWATFGKSNNNRNSYVRNNSSPNKPELIYPQNQSFEIPIKFSFIWDCSDPEDDELSYDLYLGEDDNLSYIDTVKATSYEINLENNKRYYWKIVASDGEKNTESETYTFNTIPSPAETKFKTKVEGASIFSPAISDDNNIFISTSNGNIYQFNSNGILIWKYETNGFIKAPVVLNPYNQIIVGNSIGELYIINSNGTLSNKVLLNNGISKPISLSGFGEIYAITDIGTVYKLSSSGNELWHIDLSGKPTTNIVVDNSDNIYFGLNNSLYSIDSNGNIRFKLDLPMSISSDLSIDDNENIYFATEEKSIYSITKNGKIYFKEYINEYVKGSILIDNNNSIVFGTTSGNLYRYYYFSDYFEKITLNDIPYSTILMDEVKYISTKNKFIVYNGELRWFDNYSKIKHSPNIDINGVIVFGTTDGYLYGIYGDSPNLRNSDWPIAYGDRKHTGNINKNIIMPDNRPPLKPFNPYPADKSTLTLNTITLTWESNDPDGDNIYFNIYFGNDKTQELIAQNITQSYYTLNNIKPGIYYWYVEVIDDFGNIVKGDLWSFTVEKNIENNSPLKPNLLYPSNNQNDVPLNAKLEWSCSDPDGDTLTYDLYINTEPILTTPVISNYDKTFYNINLNPGTTYYWKVVAKDGNGGENSSDIYSFTTSEKTNIPPNKPILISPTNNSKDLEPNLTLYWNCSDPDGDTLTYDVYLDKTINLTTPYITDVTDTSLTISNLELGATYYWKVVAKDGNGGENSSEIYSFTIKDNTGPLTPKLYFNDTFVNSGDQGELIIHGQKLENVQAFDIEIKYDNTKIQISSVEAIGELQGKSLIINENNGKVKITNLSFSPYTINNSDILKIKFTAIGDKGNTEVSFTNGTKIINSNGETLSVDITDIGIISIK
ncbi:hypothetical protein [Marinitoga sp. 38H-ov]|uniref:hypothetical protein n=1 Tax=Marinitoga sp. 38H-ov TaxID=1755814 RepID=UPI0013EE1F34|nr:hypothetical protein [Marinitoga sp. 38H-ov]KAF2955854.1 hypothetical protein AS160_08725 [Marinitoga sp. 38H-ov]